ncbi:HAD family phosphatase [Flavobacterium sp. LS1R49]|uniref:HAD family phosphatase n=1 Tax=Flavobacterium shii TaxID=2987687 RepID=A0A9X2ZBB0_9FLAO|nr:HAD family phosphatase [Flavobacterium shii]MCV9927290.1 HAD family phosphatase [Flavobacterium shii]
MKNKKIPQVPECIIFNHDTVLLNTETIIISVLLDKAEEHGINIELDEAVRLFSEKGIEQNIILLKNLFEINLPVDFEKELEEKIYTELRQGLEPKEGVKEMLELLKTPFCIVSDIPRGKIELNLKSTNLHHFFPPEKTFTTCGITNSNPNNRLYLDAAKTMGYQPKQCVVIVDNISEIKDRIKDGFNVYGLTNGFNKKGMTDMGAVVFEEINQLSKLLKIV